MHVLHGLVQIAMLQYDLYHHVLVLIHLSKTVPFAGDISTSLMDCLTAPSRARGDAEVRADRVSKGME